MDMSLTTLKHQGAPKARPAQPEEADYRAAPLQDRITDQYSNHSLCSLRTNSSFHPSYNILDDD